MIDYNSLFKRHVANLKGFGNQKRGFCPFHDNKRTPAFSVNVDNGMWSCKNPACDKSGNAIEFAKLVNEDPTPYYDPNFQPIKNGGKVWVIV